MKVIILAGGFGTRLSEYTKVIPKPMVNVGPHPIIWHIMNHYSKYKHNDFLIALGYKAEVIKDYFLALNSNTCDFKVCLNTGKVEYYSRSGLDWEISLIDTGLNTKTGGRIKRLSKYISSDEKFFITYGDGLSNLNLDSLIEFHNKNTSALTITAVKPTARFGELEIRDSKLVSFEEKLQLNQGWINGGFMIADNRIFDYIKSDEEMFEREPLQRLIKDGLVNAYQHDGFWQCMDSKREKDLLNEYWETGEVPWAC